VPVLHVRETRSTPGGAANVCLDLAALRGRVVALGVCGEDEAGRQLRSALESVGVDAAGILTDPGRPTTLKQNLIGLAQARHPQKMFRLDFESRAPLSARMTAALVGAVRDAIGRVGVVCIEDYNKGVCTAEVCEGVIAAARQAGKPVFVDPARGVDYAKYAGATAITPNRSEAEDATGVPAHADGSADHNAALARKLMDSLRLEACVLTLDRHGALLLERDGAPVAVPTVARQVYDVTGAGDMFLAGLAAGRANGLSWLDAVRLANVAAGLEVEVFGVQPIPIERIHQAVLASSASSGKVRTLPEVLVEVAAVRARGGKVVFTNGCFDLLHAGHVTLLDKAAAMGEYLVVGLNSDASVRRLKGPARPINPEGDRGRVLGALGSVSAVVVFEEDTPLKLIESIRPDTLVKGADYAKDAVVGGKLVESYGGRVALVDLVEGRSTTGLVSRMSGPV
jgi:D-beta-D-heptose 7-phosphate kinase / D-beta-D-heptose 1-phosphate adenosyltransferase